MRTTILTSLLLLASSAPAITLTYDPVTQNVPLGNTATVNVMASGLALNQVIGAFDVTVQWNPSLLSLNASSFSGALGGATITSSVPGAGQLNMASVSLEDIPTLAGLQATEPFALFSITFDTLALGTSPLTFAGSPFIISDGEGNTVSGVIANTGSITITGDTGVPEPSTWALLATGLLAIAGARRRRQ